MASIKDERGFNQGFSPSEALAIRTKRRADLILHNMNACSEQLDVLEIGAGTGELAYYMSESTNIKLLASDLSHLFVAKAQATYSRPNLKYVQLNFNDYDSVNRETEGRLLDAVVGNGILHHLYHDLDQCLIQMKKILKPGGRLIFMEPNLLNPYCLLIFKVPRLREWARLEPGEMAFTRGFIKNKMMAAGFVDVSVEYKDFLLPNTPPYIIRPLIIIGDILERCRLTNWLAQSIVITAVRPK